MLKIRREQVQVLEEHVFRQVATGHLRKHFPEACAELGDEALARWVDRGIAGARRHGIHGFYDIVRYLNVAICFTPDFDVHPATPWAGEILRNDELSVEDKLEQLEGWTLELLEDEAAAGGEEPSS
jgi:hypothetical protein